MIPSINRATWELAQAEEIKSWTTNAFGYKEEEKPDPRGKIKRERENQKHVLNQLRISGLAGIVLDAGCGPAPAMELVEGNWVGFGLDPLIPQYTKFYESKGMRTPWDWDIAPLACTMEAIRLKSESVHHVLTINALDHVQDPEKAMDELWRVLKPGGTLWLQVCIDNATVGNPHPAHHIDLNPEMINEFYKSKGMAIDRGEIVTYSWREQPAYISVFRKM